MDEMVRVLRTTDARRYVYYSPKGKLRFTYVELVENGAHLPLHGAALSCLDNSALHLWGYSRGEAIVVQVDGMMDGDPDGIRDVDFSEIPTRPGVR